MTEQNDNKKTQGNIEQGIDEIEKLANWGNTPKDVLLGLYSLANNISEFEPEKLIPMRKGQGTVSLEQLKLSEKYFFNNILNINTSYFVLKYNGQKILNLFGGTAVFPTILEISSILSTIERLGCLYFFEYSRVYGHKTLTVPDIIKHLDEEELKYFKPEKKLKKTDFEKIGSIIGTYEEHINEKREGLVDLAQKLHAYYDFFIEPVDLKETKNRNKFMLKHIENTIDAQKSNWSKPNTKERLRMALGIRSQYQFEALANSVGIRSLNRKVHQLRLDELSPKDRERIEKI